MFFVFSSRLKMEYDDPNKAARMKMRAERFMDHLDQPSNKRKQTLSLSINNLIMVCAALQ